MTSHEDFESGLYRPGATILHRVDPRLKLVVLPVLIVAVFAAATPQRLAGMCVFGLLAAVAASSSGRQLSQPLWSLRWVFLCTLLLHLFFSPGRTLFGLSWLSLDGLQKGMLIGFQLSLAVLFSSLLSQTTAPAELASGLSSLLGPLRRFRLPVDELISTLLLVLHFIPILRQEGARALAGVRPLLPGRTLLERGRIAVGAVAPLILGLVDRADALARAEAGGASIVRCPKPLPSLFPPPAVDLLFMAVISVGLMAVFGVVK